MSEDRKQQRDKIVEFLKSEEGIEKLRQSGVMVEDDFGNTIPFEKMIKNIGFSKISLTDFEEAFGEEWIGENWGSLLEIMHEHIEPDCLKLTLEDTEGNKILSAYINAFQLFGSFTYKQAICATIANSVFRTILSLPTERELIKDLEEDDEKAIDFLKEQLDYFNGEQRNQVVLNLVEKNAPKLRRLIKEKVGY